MVYNNPRNMIDGSRLKGAGLVKGVADMEYLRPNRPPLFIEFKLPGEKQLPEQIEFQEIVESIGHDYEIVTSVDEFKQLMKKQHGTTT